MLLTITTWAQTNYIVTLKAGEGTGDDVIISSAVEANVATNQSSANKGQFWWENENSELWFKFPDCPESFGAPEGKVFYGWNTKCLNPGTINHLTSDMELTAQWGDPNDFTVNHLKYRVTSESPAEVILYDAKAADGNFNIPSSVINPYKSKEYTVTAIDYEAFYACTRLTSVIIPASVTYIEEFAFHDCQNLTSVILNSNPIICDDAFYSCNPIVTMNLSAKAAGDYKWMTFYNEWRGFKADDNTQVFKVTLIGDELTMHEVIDKIVKAGTGVVLKSTGNPVMTMTTEVSSNTDDNSLIGVRDVEGKAADGTIYVLNYKEDTGVGFYKLAENFKVGLGKAYLEYDVDNARTFFGFGETTGIEAIDNGQLTMDNEVYNLQGRRVENPTKGLYIVNKVKVIIK